MCAKRNNPHKSFAATMFSTVVSRKSASSDATQRQALQPRNHRDMHAVGLRDLRQRLFTGIAALDGLFALILAQLSLAAEFDDTLA